MNELHTLETRANWANGYTEGNSYMGNINTEIDVEALGGQMFSLEGLANAGGHGLYRHRV